MIRILHLLFFLGFLNYSVADDILFSFGSTWKYLDNGSDMGTTWQGVGFDDALWANGNAQLGYGDGDESTIVSYGADPNNKYITTYFRKNLTIASTVNYLYYTLNYKRDDGIVIYIDGVELIRNNMPAGVITSNTLASAAAGDDGNGIQSTIINLSILPTGNHTLAVEIHQNAVTSSDISFDMQLIANTDVISYNQQWKYLDNGSNQGTAWYGTGFNDAAWASGNGQLGYGDGDENTVISYGPDPNNKYITSYFRKSFLVGNVAGILDYTLSVRRDDGIVVYLDGVEVFRNNMPGGVITFTTLASVAAGDDGNTDQSTTLTTAQLSAGNHVIAVEVHQNAVTSSDLSFDLKISANRPGINRGPYLQMGLPTSGVIRWRTNTLTDSRVRYGTTFGSYTNVVNDVAVVTDHEIKLTGLTPNTRYYYTIESSSQVFENSINNTFLTYPNFGTSQQFNFMVFGDCGNNSVNQINVRNAYLNYMQGRHTDGFLLLGDNAYSNGTDSEYQTNFYNIYRDSILKDTWLWPAPGNHDYANSLARQNDQNIPYYAMFTLPTAGEAGGVASGTEAFYSYNIGNIHFIALDSYGRESSTFRLYDTLGPQAVWLKNDLQANTQRWTIVYFHHPPYTMGSHNSDTEIELINMRQFVMPILERFGVDIVFCGHSHDYERSYLIRGHYGLETTFSFASHAISNSSARWNNTPNSCPYIKSITNNVGTVYNLVGSSGQLGGTQGAYPHNAMSYSNATNGGALALSINNNRLDAKWICADGNIRDQYTILKDVNKNTSYSINLGDVITLNSSWVNGNYIWSNGANTSSISVSPIIQDNIYYVNDPFNCVKDTFFVKVLDGLPVELSEFKVEKLENRQVKISWTTLSEINNDYFDVEWSIDGNNFEKIFTINGAGISNNILKYEYLHTFPNFGRNYYRLKQVDYDGSYTYSDIRSIFLQQPEIFLLYPNPNDGNFTLNFYNSNEHVKSTLTIIDFEGKIIYDKEHLLYIGENNLKIETQLKSGQYYCILGGLGKTLSFVVE